MTYKKLTDVTDNNVGKISDSEIVKALECCIDDTDNICQKCPIFKECVDGKIDINSLALDLIHRLQAIVEKCEKVEHFADKTIATQQAEIEELQFKNSELEIELKAMRGAANSYKAENERLKTNLNVELDNFASEYDDKIKAEAYKEFARLLRQQAFDRLYVSVDEINKFLKELVGDNNAS